MDDITKVLGKEIQRARDERKWSRPYMAEVTGVPTAALASYEQGYRQPPLARLVQMCDGLGVSVIELLGLALQRAGCDPRLSGVTVDLERLIRDARSELRLLRRWARWRLADTFPRVGVTTLEWSFVEELAAITDMTPARLLEYLREFAPSSAPRR